MDYDTTVFGDKAYSDMAYRNYNYITSPSCDMKTIAKDWETFDFTECDFFIGTAITEGMKVKIPLLHGTATKNP